MGYKLTYIARAGGDLLAQLAEAYELESNGDEDVNTIARSVALLYYVGGVLDASATRNDLTQNEAAKVVSAFVQTHPHLWHISAVALVQAAVIHALELSPGSAPVSG